MTILGTLGVPDTTGANMNIEVAVGRAIVFVGANGSGKTRLGAFIERHTNMSLHRVGAHRHLGMPDNVNAINYEKALKQFLYGHPEGQVQNRPSSRWGNNPETGLLTDYERLLQALYADENHQSVLHRQRHIADRNAAPPVTKFDQLMTIWKRLLPHRELLVSDQNLRVRDGATGSEYQGSALSDGERVIFYLIGQCLLPEAATALIIDEPELHIHKAILSKLWDELEALRKDCAFIYLTHDLEFAMARSGADKFVLYAYDPQQNRWKLEPIPENSGLSEEVVSRILGSRAPVLFIESRDGGFDVSVYRRLFAEKTVLPVGNCREVVKSVTAMRNLSQLHRLECVGLVDADERSTEDVARLRALQIECLPVVEIENLFLLPQILFALATTLNHDTASAALLVSDIQAALKEFITRDMDRFTAEYARRVLEERMKATMFSGHDIAALQAELEVTITANDPQNIVTDIRTRLMTAMGGDDWPSILALYSNKGLFSVLAQRLGFRKRQVLEEHITRTLRSDGSPELLVALKQIVPTFANPGAAVAAA